MVSTLAAVYLVVELFHDGTRKSAAAFFSMPMASMEACIKTKTSSFVDSKYYVRCIDPNTGDVY